MLKNTLFREKNGSRKPENVIQKKSCFRKPFKIPPPKKEINLVKNLPRLTMVFQSGLTPPVFQCSMNYFVFLRKFQILLPCATTCVQCKNYI